MLSKIDIETMEKAKPSVYIAMTTNLHFHSVRHSQIIVRRDYVEYVEITLQSLHPAVDIFQ